MLLLRLSGLDSNTEIAEVHKFAQKSKGDGIEQAHHSKSSLVNNEQENYNEKFSDELFTPDIQEKLYDLIKGFFGDGTIFRQLLDNENSILLFLRGKNLIPFTKKVDITVMKELLTICKEIDRSYNSYQQEKSGEQYACFIKSLDVAEDEIIKCDQGLDGVASQLPEGQKVIMSANDEKYLSINIGNDIIAREIVDIVDQTGNYFDENNLKPVLCGEGIIGVLNISSAKFVEISDRGAINTFLLLNFAAQKGILKIAQAVEEKFSVALEQANCPLSGVNISSLENNTRSMK